MAKNSSFVTVFSLILISSFAVQVQGKRNEAFRSLYNINLKVSSGIDTSDFQAPEQLNEFRTDCNSQAGLKEKDRIKTLPGQPPVRFNQYGGYITVSESAGRSFYYYFTEAERDKECKPLLLWLNGGPGCSSLAYGAMQELGPFRVLSDGKTLFRNKYAWNKVANVLFVESPAGVGFSYSNTSSDYDNSGDRITAKDNYMFIRNWLERFPEYKDRDFYISGESYAGHYVPQLAHTILYHNKNCKNIINLKGIIIGNAVINDLTDFIGGIHYTASHVLTSEETEKNILEHCNATLLMYSNDLSKQDPRCQVAVNESNIDTANIDPYNIYAPLCASSDLTSKPKPASLTDFDPCSDFYVHAYLNRPDVQEALHANVTKLTYDWEPCSDIIQSWLDSPTTIIPLLQEFMANGLRVWVFSGDVDSVVSVTSTLYSLRTMKLPVKTKWYPWLVQGEAGGYTEVYKGDLTFATVRGSGHQVPSYQPKRALTLIKYFLEGKDLPASSS
ncbi:hypothetical protein K2173_011269 [Erythroxylum novogranatense]|uniref:Carboxypeptidase n=1 Tax=Erythroxylum novogranatense TaxID=1862640 RepID=A0AAV8S984_9ROSI|nr:hypothetical protein K2173_011269 [Erythroxylum novogranatense]